MLVSRQLIVVLGMHRSGTSAMARGLKACGADTGDNLLPAVAGNNDRGFWEDRDINALNEQVLAAIGMRWDSIDLFDTKRLQSAELDALRGKALAILSERLARYSRFVVKDPRMCRLLPFWEPILARLEVDVAYVVVARNPLSVARSLAQRDGFAPQKSHLLWMLHVAGAMLEGELLPQAVVAFEELVYDPVSCLARVSMQLGLPFDRAGASMREYSEQFLDRNLEHFRHSDDDLRREAGVASELVDAYSAVIGAASGSLSIAEARVALGHAMAPIGRLAPFLALTSAWDRCCQQAAATDAKLSRQLSTQQNSILQRDETISTLRTSVARLEASLSRADAERTSAFTLEQLAGLLDQRVARLEDAMRADHRREVAGVRQAMSVSIADPLRLLSERATRWDAALLREHRREVEGLQRSLQARTAEVVVLSKACLDLQSTKDEHSASVEQLSNQLESARQLAAGYQQRLGRIQSSFAWRCWRLVTRAAGMFRRILPSSIRIRQACLDVSGSPLFDADWYRARYPDVAGSFLDAAEHYVKFGASEGRDPGPDFSTCAYLDANTDVVEQGMNPLAHYERHGRSEGRAVRPAADPSEACHGRR